MNNNTPNPTPESARDVSSEPAEQEQLSGRELAERAHADETPVSDLPTWVEPEVFQLVPPEFHAPLKYVYKQIDAVFERTGVKVDPTDPEWNYIQAEFDDPTGSLALTLLAAENAAQKKRQRVDATPSRELRRTVAEERRANNAGPRASTMPAASNMSSRDLMKAIAEERKARAAQRRR